jgi:hypothetical protein
MDVPTIVVKPGEGRSVSLGGMEVVFKISGGGHRRAFAVVEYPIEPGRLVPAPCPPARGRVFLRPGEGRSVRESGTTRSPRGRAVI